MWGNPVSGSVQNRSSILPPRPGLLPCQRHVNPTPGGEGCCNVSIQKRFLAPVVSASARFARAPRVGLTGQERSLEPHGGRPGGCNRAIQKRFLAPFVSLGFTGPPPSGRR